MGSAFVFAPHHLITNAHVVAGTSVTGIEVGGQTLRATVVVFDARRDVAVLYVPELEAPALPLSNVPATTGESSAVLGYPEDGPFTSKSARIRSRVTITGNDIYGLSHVTREIY